MPIACVLVFDPPRPEAKVSVPLRGMIEINGRSSLQRVVEVLRRIPEMVVRVFTPHGELVRALVTDVPVVQIQMNEVSSSILENAIGSGDGNEPVLLVQSDLPLLTEGEIRDFLAAAAATVKGASSGAAEGVANPQPIGLCLQISPANCLPPEVDKRTFRLQEGKFCIGRVVATCRSRLLHDQLWASIDMLLQDPLKLVGAMGMVNLMKLAAGTMKIRDVETIIAEQVKTPVRILPLPTTGFVLNLAKAEDIAYAGAHCRD
jgi:hypothetical protein